jgi:CDP-glycerol glycerophosphotransferase
MKIKRFLIRSIRKTIAQLLSNQEKRNHFYVKNYEKVSIREKTVLYEVRDGQTIVDSPFIIYEKLSKDERFQSYTHVWVIDSLENPALKNIDQEHSNVKIVIKNSKDYCYWLLAAKYLINSSTFPSFFIKKADQVYINTWHGTPLKSMGFKIPDDPSASQNVVRNFLMTDFLLASNSFMTKMYLEDYKMDGIYKGEILEAGYPRIDWTINYQKRDVHSDFNKLNLDVDEKLESILYCPTWKGKKVTKTNDDVEQIVQEALLLKNKFSKEYNFFLKVHPFIYNKVSKDHRVKNFLVPDSYDANKCLAGMDILITDYSSIFFDFLVTDKPILFYVWDSDIYEQERGLSLSVDELPGPIVYTVDEVITTIETIDTVKETFKTRYQKLKSRASCNLDGNSTDQYVEYIFLKQDKHKMPVIRPQSEKKKILFFPGRMKNNGITSSFLNLVSNIDYSAYDVAILIANPLSKEEQKNVKRIPEECLLLFRPGKHAFTFGESIADYYFETFGVKTSLRKFYPMKAYQREMKRLLGDTSFDVAIDFSGYSYFWGKFIAATNSKKKIIFQHNDLLSDSLREINGKQPHKINLQSLFTIYFLFDRVLSVSNETMRVNQQKLAKYLTPNQTGVVRNSLNISQILDTNEKQLSEDKEAIVLREKNTITVNYDGVFKVYSQISHLFENDYKEIFLSKKDLIRSVAIYNYQEEIFFKIVVNNVYQGWIASKFVENKEVENLESSKVQLIGTVNVSTEPIFYSDVTSKQSGTVIPLNKTYVFLSQKVAANEEEFYLAENKQELGWIKTSDVSNIHNLKHFSFLKQLFFLRNPKFVSSVSSEKPVLEINNEKHYLMSSQYNNFVTMGRLSPEKNQANLIRGFVKVVETFPESRLYLLGEGPLKKELAQLIEVLGLSENVYLLGHIESPFKFVKQCDLFVLPSYYEGQPMVLLECLTLGMNVLASDIPANRSVIKESFGFYISDTNEVAIADALLNQIRRDFPKAPERFNASSYNDEVMEDFYTEIN